VNLGNDIFAGTYSNGVSKSTDNGNSWLDAGLSSTDVRSLAAVGNNLFAGSPGLGVLISTNNAGVWNKTALYDKPVYSLAVNQNRLFAGTYTYGVFVTTNNGTTWSQTSLNSGIVYTLAIYGDNIYAGTNTGVFISTDNGASWVQTSLNDKLVYSLAVNSGYIIAGTVSNGVYVSGNNGSSWIQKNEGLGNITVNTLLIVSDYVYAGTNGRSVFRRPVSDLVPVNKISSGVPDGFKLYQNYPNPFNPATKIHFDIPVGTGHGAFVQIQVFDILGREIQILVNEELKPGSYEVTFDASDLPSGVYYYKIISTEFSQTKKMVLIK
jgi:hypothetical protein